MTRVEERHERKRRLATNADRALERGRQLRLVPNGVLRVPSMQEVSTFNGSDSIFTPMTTQIRSGKVSFLRE